MPLGMHQTLGYISLHSNMGEFPLVSHDDPGSWIHPYATGRTGKLIGKAWKTNLEFPHQRMVARNGVLFRGVFLAKVKHPSRT